MCVHVHVCVCVHACVHVCIDQMRPTELASYPALSFEACPSAREAVAGEGTCPKSLGSVSPGMTGASNFIFGLLDTGYGV